MTFVRNNQKERSVVSIIEWHIAIYLRLSKEDGDKAESDSIQNQRKIIENHIRHLQEQGEVIASVEVYPDDGYSGGNFERPAYRRMIADIEAGKINCVIFKDNSRLGRNYPELGKLMEDYFPQKRVRVISVLNNIDSQRDPQTYCSALVSFSNIMNDDYIRQLSVKIKSTFAMKRERGEFLGNYAPYGYAKSAEDKHKLVIDPEAAEVVRMIYRWYEGGSSASAIVKQLNALHIEPPSVYKQRNGCKGFDAHSSGGVKQGVWALTTVNSILKDEVYIGNLVQGKYKSASYRTKKLVQADVSEWTVVEGTHEPIITDEQFAIVHERFARHTRVAPGDEAPHLLSGYVRCAKCGGRMNRCVSNGVPRYRCMTRIRAPERCDGSSVKEAFLEAVVFEVIRRELQELVDAKAVIDAARARNGASYRRGEFTRAIEHAQREKERLQDAKFRLYNDFQSGVIDKEDYAMFRDRYEQQIAEQDENVKHLQKSLSEMQEARRQDDEFVAYFARYGSLEHIDRSVLSQLLDRVEFRDAEHVDVFVKYSPTREQILNFARNEAVLDECGH